MFTYSPIGARRIKTDLQTSELKNVFIEQRTSSACVLNVVSNSGVISKKTSPGNVRKLSTVTNVSTNTSPQKIRWFMCDSCQIERSHDFLSLSDLNFQREQRDSWIDVYRTTVAKAPVIMDRTALDQLIPFIVVPQISRPLCCRDLQMILTWLIKRWKIRCCRKCRVSRKSCSVWGEYCRRWDFFRLDLCMYFNFFVLFHGTILYFCWIDIK